MYGFLDFPAELRNHIYEVLFEAPNLTIKPDWLDLGAEHTNLMALCGKIDGRDEAGYYDQAVSKVKRGTLREVHTKVTTAMKRYIRMAKQMEAQRVRPAMLTRARRRRNELLLS